MLFERICRENGITTRLTRPRTPTTTGKIERWHKTPREEFLTARDWFDSLEHAQAELDAWVGDYNHHRPHRSLGMATPASRSPARPGTGAGQLNCGCGCFPAGRRLRVRPAPGPAAAGSARR